MLASECSVGFSFLGFCSYEESLLTSRHDNGMKSINEPFFYFIFVTHLINYFYNHHRIFTSIIDPFFFHYWRCSEQIFTKSIHTMNFTSKKVDFCKNLRFYFLDTNTKIIARPSSIPVIFIVQLVGFTNYLITRINYLFY